MLSFLEEFKHFDNHIHRLYTKSSYLVDDESWPPFTPNKFINLLLIRHLSTKCIPGNRKACHLNNNDEQSFTTSDVSEIFQHGEKVEVHDKIILIRGVPGIGKTILSKEIAYQWADNKLLSDTEIVLMLFLRDPGITKIKELKDLVHYFYGFSKDRIDISTICAQHLLQMEGINVTIILDGLDEIPPKVIDNTYIRLLLDRKALPCCRIVVTSRPAVSIIFQSKVDIEAEILGFTDENINIFIQNELKEDKQKKLTDYLKQNRNLYHLCYIPFILSVLVCVAREYDELPSNRVEVYKQFVVFTISRFLKRFEHSDHAISIIDELPENYKSYLLELCKYAFNALEIDQVVFTRKDITKDFPKLANAPETLYGLGLLNAVKYFIMADNSDHCISYNFLHKSIQEFLAALYVTTLSEAEQFNVIKNYFFQEKHLNMWTMYIGLNKNLFSFWHFLSGKRLRIWSKWFGIAGISPKILHSKVQCLYLFHCFSELGDKSMCDLVGSLFQLGKLDLSYCTLSLNEINTIISILERSPTTYWSELNLSHCNIGDAECQHLYKGLSTLNHQVYFDEINVDDNRLSLESLQHLIMLLVQCKTQKLYATNNIITKDNLVMEYAFAVKATSNPLLIIVDRQETAIFCQSENNSIIEYLNTRYMVIISGLYYINCHLNDEVIGLLTDLIRKHEMITDLYFWNSNISEDYLKRILLVMPRGSHSQFVFVYEAIEDDKDIVSMILSASISFTLIFLTKTSLILFNANYSHFNDLIFANPMLPETTLIETICLSHCKLGKKTIKLLIQLFNQCNSISTVTLLNNTFSSNNLKQLIYTIKSKHFLRTIFVCQNTMTHHDINSLQNEFKNIQMLLINDKELNGYNYCDKQLKQASQLQVFPSLTALRLCYFDIKDNALTFSYRLFQHCDHLREITIYYCLVNIHTVNKLLKHISTVTTLTKLNLRGNKLIEENSQALASVIANNNLEELYLSSNNLHSGVIKVAKALKKLSSLKVLDLDNNNIPEEAADELSAAIRANNSLKKLWLCGNHLGSSTVIIVNSLKQVTTLKELDLNGNQNRSEELAPALTSIISGNKSMERLSLRDNNLNDDGVIKIAQSLCKHTKLKIINLQSNNITDKSAEALTSIISSNTGLEELYLANNTLQLGVITMSTALKNISSLKVLDLGNNNIPEDAADELSAAIRANNSLEKLWLFYNHLGSSTVIIVNSLKQVTTLKELDLNGNQNRSEELAPALTSIISGNKFLEHLSLRDNNLNDDGVLNIAQSLCEHTKLKLINLRSNNITEKSAEALASIISSNTGLEKLYLGNNALQLGVITISTALKNISSLKVLDLGNNNIPEEAADELSAAIRANSSLEEMFLNDNNLTLSMSVIAKTCHNSSLKELYFKNAGISVAAANDIAAVITFNSSIQLISLSNNNLQSSGFMVIAQGLKGISSLKFLYAYGINVTSAVSSELSSVIELNFSMEELSLGDNLLEDGLIQIVESCSRLTSLKNLELLHNCISPTQVVDLASAVSKCNSLEALSLGGICFSVDENLYLNISRIYEIHVFGTDTVNNEGQLVNYKFYIFSELSRMIYCRTLSLKYQHLNVMYHYDFTYISYQHKNKFYENEVNYELLSQEAKQRLSQIDSKAMISSLQIIRTLKVIGLENNNIDEDAATELARHLHCNNILEQLWLRGNELYDKGASVVLQSLHNLSTLLILDLSYNHLCSESADGIAVVVGNNCSLQQLWLDGNELLTRGVVRIASALKKLSRLRILSLCSSGITDDAAEEISNVITNNTLLVDLLLGNNQLESKGVCTIAVAIRKLFILRKLDLSNNHITPDVTEELAVTLSNCTGLQQLFLNDNMLGTKGTMKIANALKCINTLQVLTLSNNNITESAADVLVDVLRNKISLKIVLISGNDLQTTGVNLIAQTAKNITTLQLLDVSDNNVREDDKENIRRLFDNFIIIV